MAQTQPPDPGTYQYVLASHRPFDPQIERRVSTYDEGATSRDIQHPDGRRRATIFLATVCARDALRMRGWEDVTEAWFEGHPEARGPAPEAEGPVPDAPPPPAPPAAEKRRVGLRG